MKLSISNIAWDVENNNKVYELMKKYHFIGLEIAPTKLFPENPYENLNKVKEWKKEFSKRNGFLISSMQSIWFGRNEKIFQSEGDRTILYAHTKKAIDFANVISCRNLVFGCPTNRWIPDGVDADIAIPFFHELSEYALSKNTVIGIEANPPIYHTNYINDTHSALELIEKVKSKGFRLNLDIGTMIQNQESEMDLEGHVPLISHVHISEPGLQRIKKRDLHKRLADILQKEMYDGFVSIEMGKQERIDVIEEVMEYVKEIFG